MTTTLQRVSRQELERLIFSSSSNSLTKEQRRNLRQCVAGTTKAWTGYINEEPICVWGLIPPTLMSETAYLWLQITPAMKEHVFIFVRHSQIVVEEMLKDYAYIVGETKVGEDKSIRWLKWLGAEFGEPQGLTIPFVIRRKEPRDG